MKYNLNFCSKVQCMFLIDVVFGSPIILKYKYNRKITSGKSWETKRMGRIKNFWLFM